MKHLFSAFLLCSIFSVQAQFFTVDLVKKKDTLVAGTQQEYVFSAAPLNGFSSSIYVSALQPSCFAGQITFSSLTINSPYPNQKCTIKVDALCPSGLYDIILKAYNGPVIVYDTLSIEVRTSSPSALKMYYKNNSALGYFDIVNSIHFDSDGTLHFDRMNNYLKAIGSFNKNWTLLDKDSLYTINNCAQKTAKEKAENDVSILLNRSPRLYGMRGKHYFFSTSNGVAEFDSSYRHVRTFNATNSPFGYSSLLIDNLDQLWLITEDAIAKEMHDGSWKVINKSQHGLPSMSINCILEDNSGNIWFGSGSGLHKYDGTFWTSYTVQTSPLSSDGIVGIQLLDGKIHGCTLNSIFVIGNNLITNYPYPEKSASETFTSFFALSPGWYYAGLYIEAYQGSLVIFQDGTWYKQNADSSNFPRCDGDRMYVKPGFINSIKKDKEGNLWMAVQGCGIITFRPEKQLVTGVEGKSSYMKNSTSEDIKLAPNPASGAFTVLSQEVVKLIEIYDMQGNKLLSTDQTTISQLPKGVFLAKVRTDNGLYTKKVTILE